MTLFFMNNNLQKFLYSLKLFLVLMCSHIPDSKQQQPVVIIVPVTKASYFFSHPPEAILQLQVVSVFEYFVIVCFSFFFFIFVFNISCFSKRGLSSVVVSCEKGLAKSLRDVLVIRFYLSHVFLFKLVICWLATS